jgi:hypothetical protein
MEWRAGMESLSPSTINVPALGRAQASRRRQARRHGGMSWPSSTLRPFSNGREGGSWPTSRARAGRIRTVAIPIWVKHGIDAWMTAAGIEDGRLLLEDGRLLRSVSKSGKVNRDSLSDWAV